MVPCRVTVMPTSWCRDLINFSISHNSMVPELSRSTRLNASLSFSSWLPLRVMESAIMSSTKSKCPSRLMSNISMIRWAAPSGSPSGNRLAAKNAYVILERYVFSQPFCLKKVHDSYTSRFFCRTPHILEHRIFQFFNRLC